MIISLIGIGATVFIDLIKEIAEMGDNISSIKDEIKKNALGLLDKEATQIGS